MQLKAKYISKILKYFVSLRREIEFIIFLFSNQQCNDAGAADNDESRHDDHQELLQAAPALPEAGGPHPVAEGRGHEAHRPCLLAEHLTGG